jgi:uncharacterized protein
MNWRCAGLLVGVCSLSLAGCATGPPPTFYLLHSPDSVELTGVERGVAVGVGPVELAPYLDRPQIVNRDSRLQLDLSEANQWAEPLKFGIPRSIAVNLSNLLQSNRVYLIPMRRQVPLDYQVAIDIPRFDGQLGGDAILSARWTLFRKDTSEVLLAKISVIREASESSDYEAMVAAGSRALEKLSEEIANAIKAHEQ